jgi:hypothetical protein
MSYEYQAEVLLWLAQIWAKCINEFNESIIELKHGFWALSGLMNPTNELKHETLTLIYIDKSIVELKHDLWALNLNNENSQSRVRFFISKMNLQIQNKVKSEP